MNRTFLDALECRPSPRIPFVPAIYEHKAWFVNSIPSTVCRDAELFTQAILAEYEQVRADALVVGMDVYNVEAEAAGCRIAYYDGDDHSIPSPIPGEELFHEDDPVASLKMPDPSRDGRMPLMIEVARRVHKLVGDEVPIRGAVSAPFSFAANLAGPQNLFMLIATRPEVVQALLAYAVNVIGRYCLAFIEKGCQVIVYDSLASPPLMSPLMYRNLVLPPTAELIRRLQSAGMKHVPLIIGGNTTRILDTYLETGANNILCDDAADMEAFLSACSKVRRAFRRNLSTKEFLTATPEELRRRAFVELSSAHGYPGFIFGTGVVPFGTPLNNLVALREAVSEFSRSTPKT